jgi:hypothetical protein
MNRFTTAAWMFVFAVLAAPVFSQNTLPRLAVAEFSVYTRDAKVRRDAAMVRKEVESRLVRRQMLASRQYQTTNREEIYTFHASANETPGQYQIISQDEIDAILRSERIAVNSLTLSENIRKLKAGNVSYLITGSVDAIDSDYAITMRIFDVSIGQFFHSDDFFIGTAERELRLGIDLFVAKFFAGMAGSGEKTYKPGDPGPTGGIVFYDKGFFSGGWRYLEAAPQSAEFTAQWGARGKEIGGTARIVGGGRQNTLTVMDSLRQQGESGKAVQQCFVMHTGGVVDWFLPSKDELDLMYKNLKAKELGGFSNGPYWSSSQIDLNYAWTQNFRDGTQNHDFKETPCLVRAIRAF